MALATAIGEAETEIRKSLKSTIEQELSSRDLLTPERFADLMKVFPSGAEVLLDQLAQNSSSTDTLLRIADALRLHVQLRATPK